MSEQEVVQQPEAAAPAAAPELTIADLQNIRSVIDMAARRGAFGAGEMTAVGGVFNKLDTFLTAIAPAQGTEGAASPAA